MDSAKLTIDELASVSNNCDRPEADAELSTLMSAEEALKPFSPPSSAMVADTSQYEGVAMTLLLDSPKWFQRRYSVMVANILQNLPARWALQVYTYRLS